MDMQPQTRTDGQGDGAGRFSAFISYAHADAPIAARLHRRLEAYRLPRALAALSTGGASRIGAVFRDRADLAAATSLSDAIRDALSQSSALIVLCSPDAARSRWVAEEIRLFRTLHPDRPVLAAIVRGAPEEAMPAALTQGGSEPLAADLRKEGDGAKLGLLKLVAALANVPLDALIQRDGQRQLRRVIAVTLVGLAALIAMATMTALAIKARNDAQRQRAEAEGLVEYMLTDLRTRLKGVGRTDVMRAVNGRAMDYYRRQGALSALPADSLERRARLLMAMGEDDVRGGLTDAAMQKFSEAYRATAALLSRQPDNPDRIFAHAQSEYWVGSVLQSRQDFAAARRHYDAYRTLALDLIRRDPDQVRALRELGYAEGNLCAVATLERSRASVGPCESALHAMQRVAQLRPHDPEVRSDVINRYGWLVDAHVLAGNIPAGLASSRTALQLARDLAADDPENFDRTEVVAGMLITLATFERRHGITSADSAARGVELRGLITRLRARDPDNRRWRALERMADAALAGVANQPQEHRMAITPERTKR